MSKATMTRKEAFNVLFDLYEAYTKTTYSTPTSHEHSALCERSWEALTTIIGAAYGPRRYPQLPFLCEVCRSRYAEGSSVHLQETPRLLTWCCASCRTQLQAENKLVQEEGKP